MKDSKTSEDKITWTAYIQGTNDYIFRGISNNNREPTPQAGIDASDGIAYVGAFTTGVNFQDSFSPSINNLNSFDETDLYFGIKPKVGDIGLDFGFIAYTYPGTSYNHPFTYNPTYVEFKAGASATVLKDLALSGTVFLSPDYFLETGPALTLEGTASKPVYTIKDVQFIVAATVGHTFYFDKFGPAVVTPPSTIPIAPPLYSYTYWNIGLTTVYKKLSLDLRYWSTDLSTGKTPCGANSSVFQCGNAFAAIAKFTF